MPNPQGTITPMTGTQKLLARASGRDYVAVGDVVYPEPDWIIVHDGYVETVYRELDQIGYGALRHPEKTLFVTDHEVAYGSQRAVERGASIRQVASRWNIGKLYDVGRGGHGHLFPIEDGLVRPGMFVFAYDMHCTNFGAVGTLAIGVGVEISAVLATGTLWTQVPETIRIELEGALRDGVHARDVGFVIAAGFATNRWNVDHDYRVVEYAGAVLRDWDQASRVALCNSITELGVTSVLFAELGDIADDPAALVSDADAPFLARIALDLGDIEPQVALPGGPERARPVGEVAGRPIQHAFIGSCGSGMYQDFIDAMEIVRGARVADGVRLFVVPGTTTTAQRLADDGVIQEFMRTGAIVLPPGCGPCAGGLMAPLAPGETSISTAATNHEGRFGPVGSEAYLGSPLTVAASAVAGCITDPRGTMRGVGR